MRVTNIIPWFYADDALISSAELKLTVEQETTSVPEPTSTVGMVGLVAIAALSRKQQQKK
ncbi:MAG: PEP-CTERM sorting domain-containing protein [Okeania sp. SIO3I5]|nr:PEP-CTERM sorting domain-containing protein [Okeania sp. SIO3I5]